MTLPRLLLLAFCLIFARGAIAESILFIAASPVPPGKFKAVAELAGKHGLQIEAHFAERIPADRLDTVLDGHDFVVFDAARSHMQDAIKRRLDRKSVV